MTPYINAPLYMLFKKEKSILNSCKGKKRFKLMYRQRLVDKNFHFCQKQDLQFECLIKG